jgi:hypothetical protein
MNTVSKINSVTNCGERMSIRRYRQCRYPEAAVLSHLARYRLTVYPALSRLPEFSRSAPSEINAVLRACRREGLIDSAPLYQGVRYWFLTAQGARRCGRTEVQSGSLSEPAKLRGYAMLRFCCLADPAKHRRGDY